MAHSPSFKYLGDNDSISVPLSNFDQQRISSEPDDVVIRFHPLEK